MTWSFEQSKQKPEVDKKSKAEVHGHFRYRHCTVITMLSVFVVLQVALVVLRILFDFLNYVPASICLYHSRTVENCTNNTESYNIVGENLSKTLNTAGAFLEVGNSALLLLAIFCWDKFNVKNYCKAITRVGHFWVWIFLCLSFVLSLLQVNLTHGKDEGGAITPQGIAILIECLLVTFLACTINFIAKETYDRWTESRFAGRAAWQRACESLYNAVLVSYFLRHLGLFLYDTALVAMSISLNNAAPRPDGTKDWNSLLLVLNTTFRGSIVKFFFVKLFQGRPSLTVCENDVEEFRVLTTENIRDRLGGYQIRQAQALDENRSLRDYDGLMYT